MSNDTNINTESIVEALIFASSEPVQDRKLAKIAGVEREIIQRIITKLNEKYRNDGNSFEIRQVGGGYSVYILSDFATWVEELLGKNRGVHLTRSMFEALAIIAVKQPITKPVIDKIRGVNSSGPVTQLLKQGLITFRGRASSPGRPFIYGTTIKFLKVFGLNSPQDIPTFEELEKMFAVEEE
ncbi:SMC-Scp complex subunit ScpB [bacterium]|nr:SMC-Scp complex subunit ScpB [bacterium]